MNSGINLLFKNCLPLEVGYKFISSFIATKAKMVNFNQSRLIMPLSFFVGLSNGNANTLNYIQRLLVCHFLHHLWAPISSTHCVLRVLLLIPQVFTSAFTQAVASVRSTNGSQPFVLGSGVQITPRDIWQCLETLLIAIISGREVLLAFSW